jgi:hypothetical protein
MGGSLALLIGDAAAQNVDDPSYPYEPDSATVALFHFADEGDSVAVDASSNHLDARLAGAHFGAGRFGAGVSFDGDDYVFVPPTELSMSPNATYEAWVYLVADSTMGAMCVLDRFAARTGTGRALYIRRDRVPVAAATYEAAFHFEAVGPAPLPVGRWVHLAAIFDETTSQVRLAVDGVVVASEALGCCTAFATYHVMIGRDATRNAFYFFGRIDEVRVSSTARDLVRVPVVPRGWSAIKRQWR